MRYRKPGVLHTVLLFCMLIVCIFLMAGTVSAKPQNDVFCEQQDTISNNNDATVKLLTCAEAATTGGIQELHVMDEAENYMRGMRFSQGAFSGFVLDGTDGKVSINLTDEITASKSVFNNQSTSLYSLDDITWNARSSGTAAWLTGVTYGGGAFVAVGETGAILTSPDGITWTIGNSGTTNYLWGVTYGSGIFVAVGDNHTILTSPDGITWTIRNSGTTIRLEGVTYGSGTFVAVGGNGSILTSPDGITWTIRNSGTTNYLWGVTYGNGTFVAVGYLFGTIFTSTDGITWTTTSSGTANWITLVGVTYGNGTFVVVGSVGTILQSGLLDNEPPCSITVYSPNCGENLEAGAPYNIT